MWYTDQHASTIICPATDCRRAKRLGGRASLSIWIHRAARPDATRQRRWPNDDRDCHPVALQRSDRAQCHSHLHRLWPSCPPAQVIPPAHALGRLRRPPTRPVAGAPAPESAHVRQDEQRLDAHLGSRGQLRRRYYPAPPQRRNHPHRPHPAQRLLEACQALDHQPRSRLCQEKKGATG